MLALNRAFKKQHFKIRKFVNNVEKNEKKKKNVDKLEKDINLKHRFLFFEIIEHKIFEKLFINLIDLMLYLILKRHVYELLLKKKMF